MTRSLSAILFAAALPLFAGNATAQVGIAVAKDDDHSTVRYCVSTGGGAAWRASDRARKTLKGEGYKKVFTQPGQVKAGHNIKSGVYVVVKVRYKLNGRWRTSVGMGASESSYAEAEKRAVKNLSVHDWSWSPRRGKPHPFRKCS